MMKGHLRMMQGSSLYICIAIAPSNDMSTYYVIHILLGTHIMHTCVYIIISYCQLYKNIHNLDCIAFNQYFCLSPLNHTRSHNLSILCKSSNIDAYRHSFFIRLPFLWNSLPSDVVNASSHRSFKCQVSAHLANLYNPPLACTVLSHYL